MIHDPAPVDMDAVRVSAVIEDVWALAPGILEGIRQDRHRGEVAGIVHLLGQCDGG